MEDAVGVAGGDAIRVYLLIQPKGAGEGLTTILVAEDAIVVAFLLLLIGVLEGDGERIALYSHAEVFLLHTGEFHLHDEVIFLIMHIEGRRPTAEQPAVARRPREIEEAIHLVS